ncbi:hypothetical protein [Coleofasciculus sp. G2-EDA-02]
MKDGGYDISDYCAIALFFQQTILSVKTPATSRWRAIVPLYSG